MNRWTALVAMKQGDQAKSRLAGLLDLAARTALATDMARHVVSCLHAIEDIRLLAPAPALPGRVTWMPDGGAGLNAELGRACAGLADRALLVIHADLPFLTAQDVDALLEVASHAGAAIAPDRHGAGTNALAFTQGARHFAFGPDSLSRHRRLWPEAAIVRRHGLAFDLDTPADFAEAAHGAALPMFVSG